MRHLRKHPPRLVFIRAGCAALASAVVPEYDIHSMFTAGPSDLEGWHVWVEGKELKYQTETKALLNGIDFTGLLRSMSIDIASFGHWDTDGNGKVSGEISRLAKHQQEELMRAGLLNDDLPLWSVRKTYHWQQLFPARKTLHVKHEYKPGDVVKVSEGTTHHAENYGTTPVVYVEINTTAKK